MSQVIGHYYSIVQLLLLDAIVHYCSMNIYCLLEITSQYTFEYSYLYFKKTFQIKTNMVFDKDIKTINKLAVSYFSI